LSTFGTGVILDLCVATQTFTRRQTWGWSVGPVELEEGLSTAVPSRLLAPDTSRVIGTETLSISSGVAR